MPGYAKGRGWNQAAVRHDGGNVGFRPGNPLGDGRVHPGGVNDVDAQLRCPRSNGRRREHAFAAHGCVRAGQNGDDVEPGLHQRIKGWDGNSGRSREEDPHPAAPAPKLDPPKLEPPKLEPTVLARFAVVRSVTAP